MKTIVVLTAALAGFAAPAYAQSRNVPQGDAALFNSTAQVEQTAPDMVAIAPYALDRQQAGTTARRVHRLQ